MDSRLNIALVGYGKFGRKYYSNIKSLNNFNLKVVFKKKIRKKFLSKNIKLDLFNIKNLKKYNIDCAIIATSINSHYKIAKVFLKRKIPIIIEKPVTSKVKEIKDLIKISKKNKVTVLVNHSDLYNNDFEEILKHKKKIGKINFLEAKYGKYQDYYKGKNFLPFFDWFSHPLAVISKFVSLNVNPRIVYNKIIKKNGKVFQNIKCNFYKKKNKLFSITFSNMKKNNLRNLLVSGSKGKINYDGNINYNNYIVFKNKKKKLVSKLKSTPLINILLKLNNLVSKKIYFNELDLGLSIQKVLVNTMKKI